MEDKEFKCMNEYRKRNNNVCRGERVKEYFEKDNKR